MLLPDILLAQAFWGESRTLRTSGPSLMATSSTTRGPSLGIGIPLFSSPAISTARFPRMFGHH